MAKLAEMAKDGEVDRLAKMAKRANKTKVVQITRVA